MNRRRVQHKVLGFLLDKRDIIEKIMGEQLWIEQKKLHLQTCV